MATFSSPTSDLLESKLRAPRRAAEPCGGASSSLGWRARARSHSSSSPPAPDGARRRCSRSGPRVRHDRSRGCRRRARQRSDRPADLCRGRARPLSPVDPSVFDALASPPGVSIEATVVPRLGAALAGWIDSSSWSWTTCTCSTTRLPRRDRGARETRRRRARRSPLSARGGPRCPLGALRARGLALEIGPDDLRMDEAAGAPSSSARAGVDLPDDQ